MGRYLKVKFVLKRTHKRPFIKKPLNDNYYYLLLHYLQNKKKKIVKNIKKSLTFI